MRDKPSKNPKLILITSIGVLVVFAVLIYLYHPAFRPKEEQKTISEEEIIKKQIEELERLRPRTELTEKEIQSQIKELGKLRPKESLSQDEIKTQLEELNKLK